ncbi:hypothetical protein [Sinomonas mesophila]|uniref:hypothetical protein n=1 Tax=Sinomonas mesophila TaxID=1531955 RepID=UPI0011159A5D|nr:hypothetical protein [Sinomonas mesophila]
MKLAAALPSTLTAWREQAQTVAQAARSGDIEDLVDARPGTHGRMRQGRLLGVTNPQARARHWLPSGWWTGPVLGLFLLVISGTLDSSNIDFAILGPNWLAVLLFTVLALVGGSLVVAAARWASHRVPALSSRTLPAYLPLLAAIVYFPAGVLLILGALVQVVAALATPPGRRTSVPRWAGRAVLGVIALLALPAFLGSLITILAMR